MSDVTDEDIAESAPALGSLEVIAVKSSKKETDEDTSNILRAPDITELKIWQVMVRGSITPEIFCKVCRHFMRDAYRNIGKPNNKRNWVPIRYPLPCIHSMFNRKVRCYFVGHFNKQKRYAQLRQSTFINWTYKYLGELAERFPDEYGHLAKFANKRVPCSNTFFKCYHIALISRIPHDNTREEVEGVNEDKRFVVRHLCGCSYCCNPAHLKFGQDLQNRADQAYHVTRDLCCATQERYDEFKKFIKDTRPESMSDVII